MAGVRFLRLGSTLFDFAWKGLGVLIGDWSVALRSELDAFSTVEKLFARIRMALKPGYVVNRVAYDAALGYPLAFNSAPEPPDGLYRSHADSGFAISEFVVLQR